MARETTYKDAGVDIDAGNEAVRRLKTHVKSTFNKNVLLESGHFGGAFSAEELKGMENPVLVSSVDGVGTKTKIAAMMSKWDTIGMDLVNHCCNDIACVGAKPLFFMDYFASSSLNPSVVEQVVKGLAEACRENGAALIAGETAEMPGVYEKGEIDLVGAITGVVGKGEMIKGDKILEGDTLIGLPSTGLHTNGYSLARKVIFDVAGFSVNDRPQGLNETVGQALLRPHRSYVKAVLSIKDKFGLRGVAHITGGGLVENVPRILPKGLGAEISKSAINIPKIFSLIREKGNVPEKDMWRTFNMGIGLVMIVPQAEVEAVIKELKGRGEKPAVIGGVSKGKGVNLS